MHVPRHGMELIGTHRAATSCQPAASLTMRRHVLTPWAGPPITAMVALVWRWQAHPSPSSRCQAGAIVACSDARAAHRWQVPREM